MAGDLDKIAELNAIVAAVRDRVRNGTATSAPSDEVDDGALPPLRAAPVDLMPLVHARDAAQAKVAAIGSVNPRAGGVANSVIQGIKKAIARSLQWFVRDQVVFNREALAAVEAAMEALSEQNRSLQVLAAQTEERFAWLRVNVREEREGAIARERNLLAELSRVEAEARELKDIRTHWSEWRIGWEQKLAINEVQFLRAAADLQSAFQHRVSLVEANFWEMLQMQHRDYLGALDRANLGIQDRLWADLKKIRESYEKLIHTELRLLRQRAGTPVSQAQSVGSTVAVVPVPLDGGTFDYARFAERFRGTDERIRRNMEFYRQFFEGRNRVLDIGCGRGEFLEVMREAGVSARGLDLSAESVAVCRGKGLEAEVADLFDYLTAQPDGEFDGILSSQVVEHLPPERLPEMIRLCASKLERGGLLAIETPNPECLAIFATHFYLDPTHTRPMPHQYVHFCMEEAGLAGMELHYLSPAIETMPELGSLPTDFRERFFGGLDYAIIGRKI